MDSFFYIFSFILQYKTPVSSFMYSMHFTFSYTLNDEMKSVLLYANEIDGIQQQVLTASLSNGYT